MPGLVSGSSSNGAGLAERKELLLEVTFVKGKSIILVCLRLVKNVSGLNVTMHDAFCMCGVEPRAVSDPWTRMSTGPLPKNRDRRSPLDPTRRLLMASLPPGGYTKKINSG
jgi:hypothetical protein